MSKRLIAITAVVVLSILVIAGTAAVWYYNSLKQTPQYSVALLVDAAKRDDSREIDQLVDINAVVDDFIPQITRKAVEMYGRGVPPEVIERVAAIAAPILPAVKERARAELPRVIRERSERFGNVPFFAMVLGADRYLNISETGDTAVVTSKIADRLFEMKMRRSGGRWQIVGVRDEQLATDISHRIGQEIIAIATKGGKSTPDQFGITNMGELLRQAEEMVE